MIEAIVSHRYYYLEKGIVVLLVISFFLKEKTWGKLNNLQLNDRLRL
jgi:hypothetical protein